MSRSIRTSRLPLSIRSGGRKQLLTSLAVVTLGAVLTGPAYAVWTANGTGTGTGTTATNVAVTLSPATPAAGLYPGGQTSAVLTASNANTSSVRITMLALDTTQGSNGFAVDAGHPSCTVASLTYASQTNGGSGWTVPAKAGAVNGTLPITLAGALAMTAAAPNACQGATFTVYLTAS